MVNRQQGRLSKSRREFLQRCGAIVAAAAPGLLLAQAPPGEPGGKVKEAAPPGAGSSAASSTAASTAANSKLRIALVGAGGQGRHDMRQALALKQEIVALCDVDEKQIEQARREGGSGAAGAKAYDDYRRLLDQADTFDALIIATPDHWHAALCTVFMKAGKHIYCEKPLTRTIAEARELRQLTRASPKVVTQTGNQATAEASLRRSVELIRAGVLGQVRQVHAWLSNSGPASDRPAGEDPIPPEMNWDLWCGPSPYRPYKAGVYHPAAWRNWLDFGTGPLGDFTCHIFNTALRALELTYATSVQVRGQGLGKESWPRSTRLRMQFPARQATEPQRRLEAVEVCWYDGGEHPADELMKDVHAAYPQDPPKHGCLFIGEKGILFTNPWNASAVIKLDHDPRLRDVLRHEPTKDVPVTLRRGVGHMEEWVRACKGEGATSSDFDFGGHLTEIGLTGVMAVRVGHDIDWDAVHLRASDSAAQKFIRPDYRRAWLT